MSMTFTKQEVQFLQSNKLTSIVPNQNIPLLRLSCGNYGPFKPLVQVSVPKWLAMLMVEKKKAALIQKEDAIDQWDERQNYDNLNMAALQEMDSHLCKIKPCKVLDGFDALINLCQ